MLSALQIRQASVFTVGWIAYASTYLLRKPLGVIKADLEKELSFTKTQLGWLDTALLLPYAVMQMTLGPIGDKFGPRKTFAAGLILSATAMVSFGCWSNFYVYFILLFLNGTAQSQCWPSVSKSLGAWFSPKVRNSIFGLFGTCAFVGGIVATGVAVYLQVNYGWRSVYLVPSFVVAGLGALVLILFSQPEELKKDVPATNSSENSEKLTERKLNWCEMWKIPVVAEVAVAMFCLKIVRYCMYMWLPMYLFHHLNYTKSQAGLYSTMFEIGGVFGSALIGLTIDKLFGGRTLYGTLVSIILSTASLCLFTLTSQWGLICNSTFIFLAGVFNCGPDMILGGSVPAELGDLDGKNSAASVVGLVNGFGSLGTFFEGPIVGLVTSFWGWPHMFFLLIGLSVTGGVAVFKASIVYARKVLPKLSSVNGV